MSGFTINSVSISGNLTRDPELRTTGSGTPVCGLRIAVNERRKNTVTNEWDDRANYFDVTVWKGLGEWLAGHLRKGDQIAVHGRLQWREWQDKDGNNRQSVDIVADSIVPVTRDGEGGGSRASRALESDVPIDTGDLPPVPVGTAATPVDDSDDIPF
jgi:single-strand DNA-binding protein